MDFWNFFNFFADLTTFFAIFNNEQNVMNFGFVTRFYLIPEKFFDISKIQSYSEQSTNSFDTKKNVTCLWIYIYIF